MPNLVSIAVTNFKLQVFRFTNSQGAFILSGTIVSIMSPHFGGGNQHGQTDSNSALTLHCGCLWFFMRQRGLYGWGEGGTSHTLVGGN